MIYSHQNVNLPGNIYLYIEKVQTEKFQNLFMKVKFQEHFPKYKIWRHSDMLPTELCITITPSVINTETISL